MTMPATTLGPAELLATGCRREAFLAACPGYRATAVLDQLRATEYSYLDASGHVYLDYTGAGLPAHAQLSAAAARLQGGCFGNPHSQSPASAASTALIEQAREAVLRHLNAPPGEYSVVFTANATGACRLVGEAYPFGPYAGLVLTSDNHNSVNGVREFARARGAQTRYVPFGSADLRIGDDAVRDALTAPRVSAAAAGCERRGLFAFPAQSNFTGVQHPQRWVELAHEQGYDVLLDAAAFLAASRLDLTVVRPDFVPVSWYKLFGFPTGVGCLVARREALARLQRPWFSGGTVAAASVLGDWHALAGDETRFEDGTPSFLQIPDVEFGLSWLRGIGLDVIHERVMCLTGWLLRGLVAARHPGGEPLARLHGPAGTSGRGGTVAFSLLDRRGEPVDADGVAAVAAAAGISIRTGCFCNPGAAEAALRLGPAAVAAARISGARSAAAYRHAAGAGGGAIRASLGLVSTIEDVEALLAVLPSACPN